MIAANEWSQSFCELRLEAIVKGNRRRLPARSRGVQTIDRLWFSPLGDREGFKGRWIHIEQPRAYKAIGGSMGAKRASGKSVVSRTNWHALICGPTGAGKSSGFFIPNLLSRVGSSAIVTEATAGFEPP